MGKLIRITAAALALPLAGCAAQMVQGAQNECAAFGFSPGSSEFADCVQRQYNVRQASVSQTLSNVGQQMAAPPAGSGPLAYLKSQTVSGTSRICVYDRMGSPYITTLGATQLCPITQ